MNPELLADLLGGGGIRLDRANELNLARLLFYQGAHLRPHQPSPTNATPTIPLSPILHNLLAAFSRRRVRHDDQRRCDMVLTVNDLAHSFGATVQEVHRTEDNSTPSIMTVTLPTRQT